MIILQGFISGLIATILFDLFNHSLNYAYNINKPKWYLLGRYFIGYRQGRFFRVSIEEDEGEDVELPTELLNTPIEGDDCDACTI